MMFTNSACTFFDRNGQKTVFEKVYWHSSKSMNINENGRKPSDSVLIIIPTSKALNIRLEDIVFKGIAEDIPLNELKKHNDFFVVKEIKPFLFGRNPHYEITGA